MLRGQRIAPSTEPERQNDRTEVRRIQLYIQGQNKRTQRFHYIICLTAILACTGGQTVHAFYANAMPCRYVVHSRTHSRSYVICHHMSYVIICHMSYVIKCVTFFAFQYLLLLMATEKEALSEVFSSLGTHTFQGGANTYYRRSVERPLGRTGKSYTKSSSI